MKATQQPQRKQKNWSSSKTHLPASHTGTEWVIADADFFIYIGIRKVVPSSGHGADENGNVMRCREGRKISRQSLCW